MSTIWIYAPILTWIFITWSRFEKVFSSSSMLNNTFLSDLYSTILLLWLPFNYLMGKMQLTVCFTCCWLVDLCQKCSSLSQNNVESIECGGHGGLMFKKYFPHTSGVGCCGGFLQVLQFPPQSKELHCRFISISNLSVECVWCGSCEW